VPYNTVYKNVNLENILYVV